MFGSGKHKTKECPSCALEVSRDEEVCPYCDYEFPPEQKGMTIMAWVFLILMILWFVIR